MEKKLICVNCNMVFHSAGLLEKHKALFCIGRASRDLCVQGSSSHHVMRNEGDGIDPKQIRTPDLVQVSRSACNNILLINNLNYLL